MLEQEKGEQLESVVIKSLKIRRFSSQPGFFLFILSVSLPLRMNRRQKSTIDQRVGFVFIFCRFLVCCCCVFIFALSLHVALSMLVFLFARSMYARAVCEVGKASELKSMRAGDAIEITAFCMSLICLQATYRSNSERWHMKSDNFNMCINNPFGVALCTYCAERRNLPSEP